jgi:hypothetical protein
LLLKSSPSQIKDLKKFQQFVLEHQHKTQTEIAQLWGDNLTQRNVSDPCQKLGITGKKTYGYQEGNEHKRVKFLEKLKSVDFLNGLVSVFV